MCDLSTSERIAADWLHEGRRVVAATLVERIGSAPLDPGAQMLVDDQGRIEGSVTGGCVEGALVGEAERILAADFPTVPLYFSVSSVYYSERLSNVVLDPFSGQIKLRLLVVSS